MELVYDSSFGKNEYLGLGWSTNIPYIERINRTGTDHLHTEGYFLSSLDGELREAPSIEEMAMEGGEFFLKEKRQAPEEGNFGLASAIIREKPSISERLEQKTAAERAAIKAEEIAKIGSIFRTSREHYDIQVKWIRRNLARSRGIRSCMGSERPNRFW